MQEQQFKKEIDMDVEYFLETNPDRSDYLPRVTLVTFYFAFWNVVRPKEPFRLSAARELFEKMRSDLIKERQKEQTERFKKIEDDYWKNVQKVKETITKEFKVEGHDLNEKFGDKTLKELLDEQLPLVWARVVDLVDEHNRLVDYLTSEFVRNPLRLVYYAKRGESERAEEIFITLRRKRV